MRVSHGIGLALSRGKMKQEDLKTPATPPSSEESSNGYLFAGLGLAAVLSSILFKLISELALG